MKGRVPPDGGSRVKLGQSADFTIGGLRVSPARRQVALAAKTRTLEPRVMQVLVALAEARPAVVPRDQLAEECWGGLSVGDDAINRCIVALRRLARDFEPQPFTIETVPRVGYALRGPGRPPDMPQRLIAWRLTQRVLALAAAGAAVLAALFLWRPWQSEPAVVSVAVTPASTSADSASLAGGLTAKLGMLNSVSEGGARLLDRAGTERADLQFEVDAEHRDGHINADLVLLNDRREVLWSKDFRRSAANLPDLEQQLAFTAGKVLECTLETKADHAPRLRRQTVKLYLNACAASADANENSLRDLAKAFDEITRQAPAFEPGWRQLALGKAEMLVSFRRSRSDLADAIRVIAAAERLGFAAPQIEMLKAASLPPNALTGRMRLVETAVARAPDDGAILESYAGYLVKVGRTAEAVDAARRAVEVDPLSPAHREGLIVALGTAGRVAEATEELRQAERLWPGAVTLRNARYLLHLRFADPRVAIRLRDSGLRMPAASPIQGSFLAARANPTAANVDRALRDARAVYSVNLAAIAHLAQTLGEFGREEELFGILLNWNHPEGVDRVLGVLFRPALRKFRHDPRMMRVAQRLGVLDYWRSSGKWPNFCSEPDLPYHCKREAAAIVGR